MCLLGIIGIMAWSLLVSELLEFVQKAFSVPIFACQYVCF